MKSKTVALLSLLLAVCTTAGCVKTTAPTVLPPGAKPSGGLVLSNLNTVSPEDVVQEMYTFGQGGGLGPCEPPPDAQQPAARARLPVTLLFYYCWDDPGRSVHITAADPSGQQDEIDLPVKDEGGMRYVEGYYQIDLTRPTGRYTFTVQGQNRRVNLAYDIDPPALPVFYEMFSTRFDAHQFTLGPYHRLHLAGFPPNEPLRLFVYRAENGINLIGWQEVQTGPDGQLWIEIDVPVPRDTRVNFAVTGPRSGEVHLIEFNLEMGDPLSSFKILCPGAPPGRLKGGMNLRVVRDTELHENPGFSGRVTGPFPAGAEASVLAGPYCADGALWWYLETRSGAVGYAPETAGPDIFLEPAP